MPTLNLSAVPVDLKNTVAKIALVGHLLRDNHIVGFDDMKVAKNVAFFGVVGVVISLIIAGLASVAPSVFGWLTAPFWILPAIANFGAHDQAILPLFLLSGSICYGLVAFMVFRFARRRGPSSPE